MRGPTILLILFTLLAGAVRWVALDQVFPLRLRGDEIYYAEIARQIADEHRHYSSRRNAWAGSPPAHPFLLSQVIPPGEPYSIQPDRQVLKRFLLLQVLISTALVLAIGLLGRLLFDPRTGAIAALLAALYPTFIAYSHYLWSENLFLLLLLVAMALAVRVGRTGGWWPTILAGTFFGLSALTREIGLLLAGGMVLWLIRVGVPDRRRALARGALLLGCALLVIAPWTMRNYLRFERLVPVSTVGWMGLREGNMLGGPTWLRPDKSALLDFRAGYFGEPDEMARMDRTRREALQAIRDEEPLWLVKKIVRNSALLFSPDSFLFRKLSRLSYGKPGLWPVRSLLALTILAYLGVMCSGLYGIALARKRGQVLLPLVVFAVVFGLHVVANASCRYRLPLMPVMIVYAAYALTGRHRPAHLSNSARWSCLLGLALVLIWPLVYFSPDIAALWETGRYLMPLRP